MVVRMDQKTDFLKVNNACIIMISYIERQRRSVCQNVQLFIGSKTSTLNVAIFKYSLHEFRVTILPVPGTLKTH